MLNSCLGRGLLLSPAALNRQAGDVSDEHEYIDESIGLHLQGLSSAAAPHCLLSMLVEHRYHLVFVPKHMLENNILNEASLDYTC